MTEAGRVQPSKGFELPQKPPVKRSSWRWGSDKVAPKDRDVCEIPAQAKKSSRLWQNIKGLFTSKVSGASGSAASSKSIGTISQDGRVRSSTVTSMTLSATEQAKIEVLPPGAARRKSLSGPVTAPKRLTEAQSKLVKQFDVQRDLSDVTVRNKMGAIFSQRETLRQAGKGLTPEADKQLSDMWVAVNTVAFRSRDLAEDLAIHASQSKSIKQEANEWTYAPEIAAGLISEKFPGQLEELLKSLENISKDPSTAKSELEKIAALCAQITTQMQKGLEPLEFLSNKLKEAQTAKPVAAVVTAKPAVVSISTPPTGTRPPDDPLRRGVERRVDVEKSLRQESTRGSLEEVFKKFGKLADSTKVKGEDAFQKLTEVSEAIRGITQQSKDLAKTLKTIPEKYSNDKHVALMTELLDKIEKDPQGVRRQLETISESLKKITENPEIAKEEFEKIAKLCTEITTKADAGQKALSDIDGALILLTSLNESPEISPERASEMSKGILKKQFMRLSDDVAPHYEVVNLEAMRSRWEAQKGKAESDAPPHFARDFPRQIITVRHEERSETFGQAKPGEAPSKIESLNASMVEGLKKALAANPTFPTDPLSLNMLRYQLQNMWGQAMLAEASRELVMSYGGQASDYHALVNDDERAPSEKSKVSHPEKGSKERAKLDDLFRFEVDGSKIKLVGMAYFCVAPKGKTFMEAEAEGFDGVKVELTLDCSKLDPTHPTLLSRPDCVTLTERRHGFVEQFKDVVFDLDFHEVVANPDKKGGKSRKDDWELAKAMPLEQLHGHHSEAFLGDCARINLQINGEQVLTKGALEAQQKALADKVRDKLSEELAGELPKDKLGKEDRELLCYEIESMIGQWMDNINQKGNMDYNLSEKAQGRQLRPAKEKAESAYNVEIRDGKVILTSTRYYQSSELEGFEKIHAYDAHRTQIVIDLAKVKPGRVLETPDCAMVTDVWHGQVDRLDEIGFERPSFQESVKKGSNPLSKEWQDKRKEFETMSLEQVAGKHYPNFEIDCDRAVFKVSDREFFSSKVLIAQKEKIKGRALTEDEMVDDKLHQSAKAALLGAMSEQTFSGLRGALPRDKFDDKKIHLLRYQVESMTNQWMYNFDKSANTAYFKTYDKQDKALSSQERDFKGTGKESKNFEIQIKDNKLIITNVVYHTVKDKKKMSEGEPAIEGYDAHRSQIVIDLTKVKPGELLLSEDWPVTDSWHGFKESLDEIEW
jgi:hypothetical protein